MTMNQRKVPDTTAGIVTAILVEQLDIRKSDLTPEATLATWMDSLDYIEIVMACEEEFGIEIPDEDQAAGILATPAALTAYVERRLNAKAAMKTRFRAQCPSCEWSSDVPGEAPVLLAIHIQQAHTDTTPVRTPSAKPIRHIVQRSWLRLQIWAIKCLTRLITH